jgi:hypothetical protein
VWCLQTFSSFVVLGFVIVWGMQHQLRGTLVIGNTGSHTLLGYGVEK